MAYCRVCRSSHVVPMLDAGLRPISNRYVRSPGEKEALFPLRFCLCRDCGMVQLKDIVPAEELKPRVDWITYNEPEDHLDNMVERLIRLPGITSHSMFLGVSFKDDTTLHRIRKCGFKLTKRIRPQEDLGIEDKGAGAETLQLYIAPEPMHRVASGYGKADMVIVRHVLEHAHDLKAFLEGLKALVTPQGYVVIEVPDCSRAIGRHDYTTLWEEHSVYFSPSTLRRCMEENGFSVEGFDVYPYAFEDSLVCIARVRQSPGIIREDVLPEIEAAEKFAGAFNAYGQKVRFVLTRFRREKGPIALFGAGHLACVYINFFGIKDLLEFVIDDNAHKKGLFMPGSQLPIVTSEVLLTRNVKGCLMALNPMSEEKVIARNAAFVSNGGEFMSIFPASPIALNIGECGV